MSVVGVDGIVRPAWEIHPRPWQMLGKSRCLTANRLCPICGYPAPVAERYGGAGDREFAPILTVLRALILLPATDTILKDGDPVCLGAWCVHNQASVGVAMLEVALVSERDHWVNESLQVEVEPDGRCMDLGMKLVGAPGRLGGSDDVDEGDVAFGAPMYLYSGSYLDVLQLARPCGPLIYSFLRYPRQPWTPEHVSSFVGEDFQTVVSLRCTTGLAVARLGYACVRRRVAWAGGRSVEARRDSEAGVKPGRQRTIKRTERQPNRI